MDHRVKGKIIVLVAPSGAGKSTLLRAVKKIYPQLIELISTTSRSPRKGEKDGQHYFFVSSERFTQLIQDQYFLEWAKVHGHYYGTGLQQIEDALARGNVIVDVDVQGADSIKKIYAHIASVIFIAPPSVEELKSRLIRRGSDSKESVELRMANALQEMQHQDSYDYLIINDSLERALAELSCIIEQIIEE